MTHGIKIIRRVCSLFCAAAVMLSGAVFASADDKDYEYINSPIPEKVLVMGDSIATGYGLEGYENGKDKVQSYSNLLKEEYSNELRQGSAEFTNKAIDGQTSWELLEDLQKGKYDSDLKNSDLILISIGGNDLLHTLYGFFSENSDYGINPKDLLNEHSVGDLIEIYSGLSKVLDERIADYGDNLKAISAYIKSMTNARVILQTVYNPLDTREKPKLFMAFVKSKITGLNEKIHENELDVQGNSNYTIADIYEAFSGQGDKLTNIGKIDIHPNAEGHRKIYETLNKLIRQTTYNIRIEKPKPAAEAAQASVEAPEKYNMSGTTKTILLMFGGAALIAVVVIVLMISKKRGIRE